MVRVCAAAGAQRQACAAGVAYRTRSVALLVRLHDARAREAAAGRPARLVVATTHVYWDPRHPQVGRGFTERLA